MPKDNFVHLHAHTSIGSMQDAMTNVTEMFKRASEFGQPALAITDHGTMAAVFDARKASKKYGVKYIPGMEAYFVDDADAAKKKRRHIVLLAKNEKGYRNLLKLNYEGYVKSQYVGFINKVFPNIDWSMLEEYHEGIICLTACGSGLISRQMFVYNEDEEWVQGACFNNATCTVERLKSIFGQDLYLEIQPHNLKVIARNKKTGEPQLTKHGKEQVVVDQDHINKTLIKISEKTGVKLAATADVHYLEQPDYEIHDMLMAISSKAPLSDRTRHRYEVSEFYMKKGSDIINHFAGKFGEEFANEVVNNTVEIANKCVDPVYLDADEVRFPKFDPKEESDYEEFLSWNSKQNNNDLPEDHAYMRFKCIKAFKQRYRHLKGDKRKEYIKRIEDEIKVLEMHNFSSYMLIVADFIKWARENDIKVGPGRGSVGGSLVAYLLDIHVVDPIQYGLLFERFHNKDKKSFPDIDTDFSPDGRDRVEQYIVNKYGKEKVAHVSNLSTMTPKVVVKDVARSLELGGGRSEAFKIANKITDTIPNDASTFDDALEKSKEFRDYVDAYPELEKYKKLVGLERTYATHAAGIVIGDIDLSTYVPLRVDKEGTVSVQYEKNRCEEMGLIKMDLLGLEHLRIIDNTIKNSRTLGLTCPEPEEVPLDDTKVWREIAKGNTIRVFQMESPHMKSLCKRIKPKNIEDLSLVNALGRPASGEPEKDKDGKIIGPPPRDVYIDRRDGKAEVEFRHKCLKPSLGETLGICVYEEQLAKLAGTVAGWDLNKADGLRKLTKLKGKNPALANKLEEDFINDAMEFSDLSRSEAEGIWYNVVEPFSGYGFNKAHGIFYSINGYHTAYYKYYYSAPFMAACLRAEAGKNSSSKDSNINLYKKEAQRLNITVLPPDINQSGSSFEAIDTEVIFTGFDAIKGVGTSAIKNILETRDEHDFASFADFLYRTSSRVVKKDVIQALAKSGCFDRFGISRKAAYNFYSDIRTKANKVAKDAEVKGIPPWKALVDKDLTNKDLSEEWSKKEILEAELETLGEYISGDINDVHDGFFSDRGVTLLKSIKNMPNKTSVRVEVIIGDIITNKLKRGPNKGKTYAKVMVTDRNGDGAKMTFWPEQYSKYKKVLETGMPIRAICTINVWDGGTDLVFQRFEK